MCGHCFPAAARTRPVRLRLADRTLVTNTVNPAVAAAQFTVDHVDRFPFSYSPLVPRVSHVIGTAIRP